MKKEALDLLSWAYSTLFVHFGCPDHTPDFRNYVSVDCPIIRGNKIEIGEQKKRKICYRCWINSMNEVEKNIRKSGKHVKPFNPELERTYFVEIG